MPKITKVRDRLVKARARAAVLDSAQAPEWLIVRSRVVLHARRDEPGARCPCCGSRWAHIIEEERGPELLIDTSQRRRWLRHETKDRATFDEIAAIAHPVDMPLRVPDIADAKTGLSPLDLLTDLDAMAHAVSGGNRSGKSTFGTDAWLPYRWLLRGGAGRMFRLLGPVRAQAHILANKLFGVEGDKPGSFPPVLIESLPTSRFAQEQTVRLVDGTEMQLTHAKSAGHLKGVSVQDTLWTEVTECKHPEVYTVTLARHADTGGQLYLDSTPKKGHWMEPMVTETMAEEPGKDDGRRPAVVALSMRTIDNPWIDPEEVTDARAAAMKVDPVMAKREFDGEWVGGSPLIFGEVWKPETAILDLPGGAGGGPDLAALGLRDITKKATRRFWGGGGAEWAIGVDVNRNPHTAICCKIYTPASVQDSSDVQQWGLFVFDEVRTWNSDAYGAAKALHERWDGLYRKGAIGIDANSAHGSQHAAHTGGRATTPVLDYKKFGFNCRPNRHPQSGKPWNPYVRDGIAVVKQLMRGGRFLVNATYADGTIRAIERTEDRGDGKPVKMANTVSDRDIAAFNDAIRYVSWPIFGALYRTPVRFR